jgi:hypothetical protein
MIRKFEQWSKRVYKPKEAKGKRPVLFILSLFIVIACIVASYTQLKYHWAVNEMWLVIGLFGFLSTIGLFVSIFGSDYWVALILGRPGGPMG